MATYNNTVELIPLKGIVSQSIAKNGYWERDVSDLHNDLVCAWSIDADMTISNDPYDKVLNWIINRAIIHKCNTPFGTYTAVDYGAIAHDIPLSWIMKYTAIDTLNWDMGYFLSRIIYDLICGYYTDDEYRALCKALEL